MGVEVKIKRTSIHIFPYTKGMSPSLEKSLSVFDFIIKRYTHRLYDYDSEQHILKIPRGVGVEHILSCFERDNVIHSKVYESLEEYTTPRVISINMKEEFKARDDHQKHAIRFITTDKEPQKIVSLDTGMGKTFCMIQGVCILKMPILIVTENLTKQWETKIYEYTDATVNDIVVLVGSKALQDVIDDKKKKHTATFYLTTIDTIMSFFKREEEFQNFTNTIGIGIKTIDEMHRNYMSNIIFDLNCETKYTIYLTATPGRSNASEKRVFKRIFFKTPIFGTYTHELKKYYKIRLIRYNSGPFENDIMRCTTKRGFSTMLYSAYMFENNNRKVFFYAMLRRFILNIYESDKEAKIFVILDRNKDIEYFHKLVEKDLGIPSGTYCLIIKDKKLREKELENNVIFTTIGSGSTGKDISNLRAIIAFTAFSSDIISRQLLGRLREIPGKSVYYYDFVDDGFPSMNHQREARMKVFEPRAASVEELFLDFDDTIEGFKKLLESK